MKKNLTKTIIAFGLMQLISCNKNECNNSNPVFEKYRPESAQYKAELVKQIQKANNSPVYYFDKLEDNDSLRFLYVDVKGDSLCAKAILTINKQDDKLDGIIKSKGKGYSGAELQDLKFEVVKDSLQTEFVFESVGKIVD